MLSRVQIGFDLGVVNLTRQGPLGLMLEFPICSGTIKSVRQGSPSSMPFSCRKGVAFAFETGGVPKNYYFGVQSVTCNALPNILYVELA